MTKRKRATYTFSPSMQYLDEFEKFIRDLPVSHFDDPLRVEFFVQVTLAGRVKSITVWEEATPNGTVSAH